MKRYLLFCGYQYYPAGGWSDFRGSFDSVVDAKLALVAVSVDWWQVVDGQTGNVEARG